MHKYGIVHTRVHGHVLGCAHKINIHIHIYVLLHTRVHGHVIDNAYKINVHAHVHTLLHTLVHGHALGCVLMKNLSLSFRTAELEDFRFGRLQILELKVLGARNGHKRKRC